MACLLPPALCGRAPGTTLHLLSSPVLCLWSQLLQSAQTCLDGSKNWCFSIPVTSSPWLHTLVYQTNSQKRPQSLLVLTSCPFSFSMQGHQHEKEPWHSHLVPSMMCSPSDAGAQINKTESPGPPPASPLASLPFSSLSLHSLLCEDAKHRGLEHC